MSILAFRFICDISFLFLCRFLLLFIFRHSWIICSCSSLDFYGRSGGVRTAFIAPSIFILLHFFFILSFYILCHPTTILSYPTVLSCRLVYYAASV